MNKIPFDNSFARMPEAFYTKLPPTPVTAPELIAVNRPLARHLGIDADWLASPDGVKVLSGNAVPEGAEPLASVYAGHQFGSYNPQLGDGRAILLGEVVADNSHRFDIQLKGSGPTPYSRGGDGRSPLGPVIREYVVSEAMHALGVPTTRALAAVTTGDQVVREQFLPGAVLARVASSHIRIGTFQYFAANKNTQALQALTNHTLTRHYPDQLSAENKPLGLLQAVVARQASLVARWQLLGFIHGVMNTDNMLICGETVDYGPCAFMDAFKADKVFSSIDQGGRYAYRNQPGIAHWNLACLAQSLLPLLHEDQDQAVAMAQTAVDSFPELFLEAHTEGMAAKLGLNEITADDASLVEELFQSMDEHQLDFTLTFRRLADLADEDSGKQPLVKDLYEIPDALLPWLARWQERQRRETADPAEKQARMYAANPVFIPRNHRVQEAISAADDGNFQPFHELHAALATPYNFDPSLARYATPAPPEEEVCQTFCGT